MKKISLKTIITIIFLGLFTYFVFNNLDTLNETYKATIAHLNGFLIFAIFFMIAAQYFMAKMFQKAFSMVGIKRTTKEMISLTLQAIAINILIPTSGVSLAVFFADEAKKRKESQTAALNGVILTFMIDFTAFSVLLVSALFLLQIINSLTLSVAIPAIIFFAITIGIYVLSFLAVTQPKIVNGFLNSVIRVFINPILNLFKKTFKYKDHVNTFTSELADVNKSIIKNPKELIVAILISLIYHLMRLVMLYIVFVALGYEPSYRLILAGYAVGVLFIYISPTPNGVGFVEGSMAITFAGLGMPIGLATTATLIYRAFEFWIPFGFGFFLLQRKRLQGIRDEGKS